MGKIEEKGFKIGDLVTIKARRQDERFCIIGFKTNDNNEQIAILKALFNDTYIIEKPVKELNSLLIKGIL
ncbi:MAG TPA: hypothetical protein VHQ70_07590 [Syntrophomonadaceae bacterium]|nr:hypothetical protein [Syntrophomonadaceae bacterium]